MTNKRRPAGKPQARPAPDQRRKGEAEPRGEAEPITTGDMQEVGAVTPAEVPARRRKAQAEGEAPVEEQPGDQNSG